MIFVQSCVGIAIFYMYLSTPIIHQQYDGRAKDVQMTHYDLTGCSQYCSFPKDKIRTIVFIIQSAVTLAQLKTSNKNKCQL